MLRMLKNRRIGACKDAYHNVHFKQTTADWADDAMPQPLYLYLNKCSYSPRKVQAKYRGVQAFSLSSLQFFCRYVLSGGCSMDLFERLRMMLGLDYISDLRFSDRKKLLTALQESWLLECSQREWNDLYSYLTSAEYDAERKNSRELLLEQLRKGVLASNDISISSGAMQEE